MEEPTAAGSNDGRDNATVVEMTSKERVLATIRGEPADKAPVYHLQFSGHAASVILGRDGVCIGGEHNQWLEMNALWQGEEAHCEFDAKCEADAVAITEACGMDILRLGYWRWSEKPTKKIDDRTFLFGDPERDWYTLSYNPEIELFTRTNGKSHAAEARPQGRDLVSEEELTKRVLTAEERAANCGPSSGPDARLKATVERYPDYLVRHGGGTVWVDMASPAELMAIAYWPELYARLLMAQARVIAAGVPALAEAGLDVNVSGADFCSAQGPCVSPATYRDVVIPALTLIVDACHEHRMFYFYTSDGNFWPVADDIFNVAGVDGWMETDRSAGMELRALRERFPNVTLQGNIRVQVLHRGTRDDVVREVMDCMGVARELGGVIVGASNLIMPGTPPENIVAMLETIEKNR